MSKQSLFILIMWNFISGLKRGVYSENVFTIPRKIPLKLLGGSKTPRKMKSKGFIFITLNSRRSKSVNIFCIDKRWCATKTQLYGRKHKAVLSVYETNIVWQDSIGLRHSIKQSSSGSTWSSYDNLAGSLADQSNSEHSCLSIMTVIQFLVKEGYNTPLCVSISIDLYVLRNLRLWCVFKDVR